MRMALARGRQGALHGPLRIALIGLLALVRRERSALPVSQLGFLQFGHATVPASVQRESRRQAQLVAHDVNDFLEAGKRIRLASTHVQFPQNHRHAAPLQLPSTASASA